MAARTHHAANKQHNKATVYSFDFTLVPCSKVSLPVAGEFGLYAMRDKLLCVILPGMRALTFIFLTAIFLFALMLVRGIEPQPSGPELFTLRRDYFYEARFVVTRQPEPAPVTGSAIAKRQHFGFPCYALIVDESHAGNFYAKLDLIKFAANGLVAGLVAMALLVIIQIIPSSLRSRN